MLKVWGRTTSSNVQKVLWCCAEIGERYERVDWGGPFGGNKDPAYLAMNPNGRVPTVQDGELVIWESNTIIRYLCATRGGGERLYPKDPNQRTQIERWMDWSLAHLGGVGTLFLGYYRTPPEKRNAAALEAARKEAIETWGIVEQRLAQASYLAGAEFTLADIPVGIWARRWFDFPIERPRMPAIEAWFARIKTRPGFIQHIAPPLG